MKRSVFILEDEPDILDLLLMKLSAASYESKGFARAADLLSELNHQIPDLILLDLMLPDMDGFEVCKRIKSKPETEAIPIIMLTARVDIEDKVKGLDYGADDYITKPFEGRELLARIGAVLRRSSWETSKNMLQISADFLLDFNRFEAFIEGSRVDLTLTEFKILQILTRRPGWVYSRAKILDYLWGTDKVVIERTVDVHIKNLREKIGKHAALIKNVRGLGYKFVSPDEAEEGDG